MSANVDFDAGSLGPLSSNSDTGQMLQGSLSSANVPIAKLDSVSKAGSNTQLFTQYADSRYKRSVYIKHGFSCPGLVFGGAWLIFHGMRGLFAFTLLTLTTGIGFMLVASVAMLDVPVTTPGVVLPALALLLAHVIIGLHGSQWRGLELHRRGWRELQLVAAPTLSQAQRFGDAALTRYRHSQRGDLMAAKGATANADKSMPTLTANGADDREIANWANASADVVQREVEVEMVGEEYREFVRVAQRELGKGKVNKAIWARAFATYADDVASVRRRYICLRAESLAEAEMAHGNGFRHDIASARLVARVANKGEVLSPQQMDIADKQVDEFVDEVVQTRRFDRYSTDLVGSTLGQYHEIEDQELMDRLASIGLRLDILSGPGSRDKPGFTEYRIVSETGDLLHLPDRSWFGLFLEKLYDRCREANVVVSHAYVLGNTNPASKAGESDSVYGARAREQFFRYMENNGESESKVYQRSIVGPDVELDQLWHRQNAQTQDEEPQESAPRDRLSADWIESQTVPNRAERLRRERGLSGYQSDHNSEDRWPQSGLWQSSAQDASHSNDRLQSRRGGMVNLNGRRRQSAPDGTVIDAAGNRRDHIDEADREYLNSVVDEVTPTRIGIFTDTYS